MKSRATHDILVYKKFHIMCYFQDDCTRCAHLSSARCYAASINRERSYDVTNHIKFFHSITLKLLNRIKEWEGII